MEKYKRKFKEEKVSLKEGNRLIQITGHNNKELELWLTVLTSGDTGIEFKIGNQSTKFSPDEVDEIVMELTKASKKLR